ncbi:LysR family transcriptional regulator [Spirillospora sp. NPDC048911]|uniref:LysR family transcriptional regulator n=1 Tax=Spirillospora sp. NPDC048911 TaxID=3364527 RepID=UPI00371243FD
MISPLHIQTVREVVRTGSFADAARNLGYTASAVSQQIAALERTSGVLLFERRARSVHPTYAAFMLVKKGNEVLDALGSLERELRTMATGQKGSVQLGSFPTASARILPRALAELTRDRPGTKITLSEGEPDELLPELLDGDLDLQLVYRYDLFPRTWPEQIVETSLMDENLVLCVPAAHPLAGNGTRTVPLRDLDGETWIASRPETSGAQALVRLCKSAGFTPDIAFRSNDYAVVCGLVARGLGIALVPALGCVPDPGLRMLRLSRRSPQRHVTVLCRSTNTNPLVKVVMRELTAAANALECELTAQAS